jgi:hypothetical protein
MRLFTGILYIVTASVVGYAALYMMMETVNGSPFSWWGPIILAASILLFVDGVYALIPRLTSVWLAIIAAGLPLAICGLFGTWPLRCWVFAGILGFVEWAFLSLGVTIKRNAISAFSASVVLVVSWAVASVSLVNSFVSSRTWRLSTFIVAVFLATWLLVLGVFAISSFSMFRSRSPNQTPV